MKKKMISIASIALAAVIVFLSCKKESSTDDSTTDPILKKISSVVYVGGDSIVFTYDSSDKVTKSSSYNNLGLSYETEYVYKNNNLVSRTSYQFINSVKSQSEKDSFVYTSDNVLAKKIIFGASAGELYEKIITSNSDGLPEKFTTDENNYYTFIFGNNNVTSQVSVESGNTYTSDYQYDSKVNPWNGNCYEFADKNYYSQNNIIKITSGSYVGTFTYEYDNENYPVKVTQIDGNVTIVKKMYYK